MIEPTNENDDSGESWNEQVDRECDQFENAFRENKQPKIEEVMDRFPEAGRRALLMELIPLEIELFQEMGMTITLEVYKARFPEHLAVIEELEREATSFVHQKSGESPESETVAYSGDSIGLKLKHFLLRRIIGQGGFGTVWKALDTRLQRDVAVKIPRRDRFDSQNLSMFLREARAAAGLKHPNIVMVHEVGEGADDSSSYIVSELIDGPSLKSWLYRNKVTPRQAATLIAMMAEALQHAHEHGIVHRDIKPANILMDSQGFPHLADFGLAKRELTEDSLALNGRLVGTPNYMAPEQARGQHADIDSRTDIYALGVILYEFLTGTPPFRGELAWLLEQIDKLPPPPPRSLRSSIPEDLEKICLKCLEKEPQNRYQTAQELADDLYRFMNGETLQGVAVPFPKRVRKWAWRNRRTASLLMLTSLICLGLAYGLWRWSRPVVFRRVAHFVTVPPGCEITAVPINHATGEPDPTRIQHASGRTPLEMPLIPGDYLIVAVLNEQRFIEVLRRIPKEPTAIPVMDRHTHASVNDQGHVIFGKEIVIPRPDITTDMAFVEGNSNWKTPRTNAIQGKGKSVSMPAFYVDYEEVQETAEGQAEATSLSCRFGAAVSGAEEAGKRLPSSLELIYLQEIQNSLTTGDTLSPGLQSVKSINGLNSLPWEWTTSIPNMLSAPGNSSMPFLQRFRMTVCGKPPLAIGASSPKFFSIRLNQEDHRVSDLGVRYVRSSRPRTRPEDFMRIIDSREDR